MMVTVALIGMFLLFALAAAAGLVDSRSQHSAWRRIATARREISSDRRLIDELTIGLQVLEEDLTRRESVVRAREAAVAERERRSGLDGSDRPPAA